jgi:hypothetical protein
MYNRYTAGQGLPPPLCLRMGVCARARLCVCVCVCVCVCTDLLVCMQCTYCVKGVGGCSYVRVIHTSCTHTLYTCSVHVLCTRTLYTYSVHVLCTRTLYTYSDTLIRVPHVQRRRAVTDAATPIEEDAAVSEPGTRARYSPICCTCARLRVHVQRAVFSVATIGVVRAGPVQGHDWPCRVVAGCAGS